MTPKNSGNKITRPMVPAIIESSGAEVTKGLPTLGLPG